MGIHPLLREPWAITAEGMAVAVAIASRDEFLSGARLEALAAREGKPLANTRSVTVRDGVGIIPIQGTMFRHADLMSSISGGVSYATIRTDLQRALDDSSITAILLDVDSPGGEVNGCSELASAIRAACTLKPVAAYVGGLGCSAAYWIASAADNVSCSSTAQLGSIGIVASYTDTSKADATAGKKTVQIVSSQSPDKNVDPSTDDGARLVQEKLDSVASVFIGDVARHRGADPKTVARAYGRGGVLVGADAVAVGMADDVSNFEAALAAVSKRGAAAQQRKNLMGQEVEQLAAYAAFERDVMVALGAKDRGSALGAIAGLRLAQDEAVKAKAELESLKKATTEAEFKRLCAAATTEQRLPPAKLASVEAMYAKHGLEAAKAMLDLLPTVVTGAAAEPKPVVAAVPTAGAPMASQFTAAELQIARQMTGGDPTALEPYLVKLAKYKQERAASAAR